MALPQPALALLFKGSLAHGKPVARGADRPGCGAIPALARINSVEEESPLSASPPWLGIAASASSRLEHQGPRRTRMPCRARAVHARR